jgi:hypothetical protein
MVEAGVANLINMLTYLHVCSAIYSVSALALNMI